MLSKPIAGQYPEYYNTYVKLVPDEIIPFLKEQRNRFLDQLKAIPAEKHDYAYAEGKWTLKQSVIHVIETERIFAYRSLSFSRGEKNSLSSFDQDAYVENHDSSHLSWDYVCNDFQMTRDLTIHQFEGFSQQQWEMEGLVGLGTVINKSLAYIIGGHVEHHIGLINNRYLS